MIYTITFNPSIDYVMDVNEINLGESNRSKSEHMLAGGKGVNVCIVLRNLGLPSKALGFTAGFTGEYIKNSLEKDGIDTDFIEIPGTTRINVKLRGNVESEINANGPDIPEEAVNELREKLNTLTSEDILVLSGSIPSSMPDDIYQQIMAQLADKNVKIVVDATKDLLLKCLEYKPFLIKPNNHELGEMFHVKLNTNEEIIEYAKKLKEMGSQNVLISMAGDGAIFIDENSNKYVSPAPKGKVKNSVGAGDSMVAGFIAGYETTKDYSHAFKYGIATGSASAFSENLATKAEVEEVYKQIA